MFFNQLYNKIGKQPHRNARTSEVIAVVNTEDLMDMISVNNGATNTTGAVNIYARGTWK